MSTHSTESRKELTNLISLINADDWAPHKQNSGKMANPVPVFFRTNEESSNLCFKLELNFLYSPAEIAVALHQIEEVGMMDKTNEEVRLVEKLS